MICNYFSEPTFFFFTSDIPSLLYYSHIPTAIIALLIGLFVFFKGRKILLNKLLFLITIFFSLWILSNLILWTNIHSDFMLFIWSFLRVLSSFISIFCIYFIYVFLEKEDISLLIKSIFIFLLAPVLLFSPTVLNLKGFNITDCNAFMFEGLLFKFYHIAFGILAFVWIMILLINKYKTATKAFRRQILLMGIGIESFVFIFFSVVFLVGYLTDVGILSDSRLEMYGLFGMTFFVGILTYLIVEFKTFRIGMITSQALIIILVILTASQFTFADSITSIVLTAFTLILTGTIGIMLTKSVKLQIKRRTEIERLAESLREANIRLKVLDRQKSDFVSIASHQLRSPITSIRGYSLLLLEGSYGKINKKAQSALLRISESAKNMAYSIEDYLNVSRIESGNMQYRYSDINLSDKVGLIVDDFRAEALKKGLVLLFRTDLKSKSIIHADEGKVIQIIQNLINNSIKYTERGSIKVLVRDNVVRKKIYVDIEDTGIGMNIETLSTIFQKFERAGNANSVNVSGTGLGLYVALKMSQAMGGTITTNSEEGKGSIFTFEMQLSM